MIVRVPPMEREQSSAPIPFRDILIRVAHGYSWQNIADEYGVSRDAVRWRIRLLYRELGVRDAMHAVRVGYTVGLIDKCANDCEFCLRVQ